MQWSFLLPNFDLSTPIFSHFLTCAPNSFCWPWCGFSVTHSLQWKGKSATAFSLHNGTCVPKKWWIWVLVQQKFINSVFVAMFVDCWPHHSLILSLLYCLMDTNVALPSQQHEPLPFCSFSKSWCSLFETFGTFSRRFADSVTTSSWPPFFLGVPRKSIKA